jgi:hypothetical protein
MNDTEFEIDIYLYQIIDSDEPQNVLESMLNISQKNDICDDELDLMYNIFTSYIQGDIDISHSAKAIEEIKNLLNNKNDDIEKFIINWGKHIEQTISEKNAYLILKKIMDTNENTSYKLTNLIWTIPIFRKCICEFEQCDNCTDIANKNIFRTLFSQKKSNYHPSALLLEIFRYLCELK